MSEAKTRPTELDPLDFIGAIGHTIRRTDGLRVLEMMQEASGQPPVMWGPSIVGFGSYHYRYPTGREGDAAAIGFSPRKAAISLYGLTTGPEAVDLLSRLGKHRVGASCLYVTRLADVDLGVLRQLMASGYHHVTTELHQP